MIFFIQPPLVRTQRDAQRCRQFRLSEARSLATPMLNQTYVKTPSEDTLHVQVANRTSLRQIKNYRRKTAIIGCAADCPPDGLRRAVAAGVSTLLVPPFSAEDLEKALAAGVSSPQSKLTGNVFAFLSAKGGDGANQNWYGND